MWIGWTASMSVFVRSTACLIHQLAVGAEAGALRRVEALDRLDEADVPLLADEVGERQPAVREVLADGDDQAEVRLDHAFLRLLQASLMTRQPERLLLVGR
jgi:hypothetical protein